MTNESKTTLTPLEAIEACVEGYRGSRDAPGFDACVKAEINARLERYEEALIDINACASDCGGSKGKSSDSWIAAKCREISAKALEGKMNDQTQTTPDRDALAAKYFPDSWKAALAPGKSKKRNQLRNAAEDMQKKEQLRAQGASCANCSCLGTAQLRGKPETICELDSDFYGYSLTTPENLCHRWMEKKNRGRERPTCFYSPCDVLQRLRKPLDEIPIRARDRECKE